MDDHFFQDGRAAEVLRIAHQYDFLLRHIRLEHERTGADRVGLEPFVAFFFDGFAADDEASGIIGEFCQKQGFGDGFVGDDLHRARIDGFEMDSRVFTGIRRVVGVGRPIQRVDHIFGGHLVAGGRSGIWMKVYALAQLKGPGSAVRGNFPGFGQIRLDTDLVAGRISNQTVENRVHGTSINGRRGSVRVQRLGIPGIESDVQDLFLCEFCSRCDPRDTDCDRGQKNNQQYTPVLDTHVTLLSDIGEI